MKAFFFALTALTAVLTQGLLVGQDKIEWTDGTTSTDVRVTEFTLAQIQYRQGGSTKTRLASDVQDLTVDRVREAYNQAYGAATSEAVGTFLDLAEKKKRDPFVAQFGYWQAAKLLRANGEFAEAFQVLETLQKELPNSGFVPKLYRWKLDYYLQRGDFRNASTVANDYSVAAQTGGYPQGAVVEANYFKALTGALTGDSRPADLRREMQGILGQAANVPEIAARARLQIADSYRNEGNASDASKEYEKIVTSKSVPEDVVAGAWLGKGHLVLAESTNDAEKSREAMMCFLRTYLLEEAAPAYAAEALYYAAQACKQWGGTDSGVMARRLRGRLQRDYPGSEYAK